MPRHTTIVVCGDGQVYDLGRREYPPKPPDEKIIKPAHRVVNAMTCPVDQVDRWRKRKKGPRG